jgi:hypothetical protein
VAVVLVSKIPHTGRCHREPVDFHRSDTCLHHWYIRRYSIQPFPPKQNRDCVATG